MTLFAPFGDLTAYTRAVTQAETGHGPLPVWIGDRVDLLDGIALAEQVYGHRRTPDPADTGVLLADEPLPEALRALLAPLARRWITDPARLPETGSVLLAGTYGRLNGDEVGEVAAAAYATGRPLFLLTGRDVHSLSWVVAKQYARVVPGAPVGVVSELDAAEPAQDADVWCGAQDVRRLDVAELALGRVWRRVLFHGNGKDDQLNLGRFTLCGASPVAAQPGTPGPKCSYGLGCTKPQDKLIPARAVRAAELVLANCFSGALAGHALYDPKYLILLNALDGPAQTVVATLTACDGQRPENLAWLTGTVRAGSAAGVINDSLRDINPYPSFAQVGLQSSGLGEESVSEPAPAAQPEFPLHTLGARLSGLLDSGLLGPDHPLRPRLRALSDTLLHEAVRTRDTAPALTAIAQETTSLDLALAHRFAKHHDDPVLAFPTYFGERSVADTPVPLEVPCACGRPLLSYRRRGRVPAVTDTVQVVCARCGDIANTLADAPELRIEAPSRAVAGDTLHVVVEATARRAGTVNLGIVLPVYLDAKVGPVLRRVEAVRAGERVHAAFTITLSTGASPQAYYFCPYAVQDLGISVSRVHFTLGTGRANGREQAAA
ncbi:hypothetical protein [Streptomyces brasiliensis]|uniref:Uncharacterized protein n=1 Tax=Streptomyces brasiliensis TaxID=1954 RepID=A0A917L831_9ACTN|nr:hypothetical protein [Streptomyces brasiliensis]GGJ51597.1 hypothetical protein GCM10010121_073130 [Streptomyces brasiliensis]